MAKSGESFPFDCLYKFNPCQRPDIASLKSTAPSPDHFSPMELPNPPQKRVGCYNTYRRLRLGVIIPLPFTGKIARFLPNPFCSSQGTMASVQLQIGIGWTFLALSEIFKMESIQTVQPDSWMLLLDHQDTYPHIPIFFLSFSFQNK